MSSFSIDDVDEVKTAFFSGHGRDEAWGKFRGRALALPDWFDTTIDPMSNEYAEQQVKLWQAVAAIGRDYDPAVDEKMVESTPDIIRQPGYYRWRHAAAVREAGWHIQAAGAIMANSNLQPGQWALEYGAGYGLIALNFARLGVNVDTVDISPEFCGFVKSQADFYKVALTPHVAEFGFNPRPGKKYDLIYFFESIHHCADLKKLLVALKGMLAPGGRVIAAGEPIQEATSPAIPYPWGIRLDSETVAVVRARGWFELGFTEDFFVSLFVASGFTASKLEGSSDFDRGYIFEHRKADIALASAWMPKDQRAGWHAAESSGRWTSAKSTISLDATDSFSSLEITATNHIGAARTVRFIYGAAVATVSFQRGESKQIKIDASVKSPYLSIECDPVVPASLGEGSSDPRALGVHVAKISYLAPIKAEKPRPTRARKLAAL